MFKLRGQMMLIYICCLAPILCSSIYLINGLSNIIRENEINNSYSDSERYRERISSIITQTERVNERIRSDKSIKAVIDGSTDETVIAAADSGLRAFTEEEYIVSRASVYIPADAENSAAVSSSSCILSSESMTSALSTVISSLGSSGGWYSIRSGETQKLMLIRPVSGESTDAYSVIEIDSNWLNGIMQGETGYISISVNDGVPFFISENSPDVFQESSPEGISIESQDYRYSYETELDGTKYYVIINKFVAGGSSFSINIASSLDTITRSSDELYYGYIWYVVLCVILSVLIIIFFVSMFTGRINILRNQMHHAANGGFELDPPLRGNDEISDLNNDLCQMVDSMQHLIDEAYSARIQSEQLKLTQVEAEFKALSSQINPHFLYNTLETIRMKAFCNDDKETASLIKTLGKFMRRCLEVKDKFVTLESELEFTRNYLDLQAVRFGDRVSYSILNEVDGNYNILPLIIQPIVENAFVHGIEGNKSNGLITVKIFYKGEYVYIDITDNGQGISEEKLAMLNYKLMENASSNGKSIGVTNVAKRIKLFHGDEYGLTITSTVGKGTRVRIILPREVKET